MITQSKLTKITMMKFYSYWNNCNYLMTVKVFTIFFFTFYSFWLTVCKHRFDLPQNYIKMKQSGALFFPEKPMQIHYIDVKPSCEVLKSAVHKCTHSMRICTLESSLFLFSSHCFHPHTHTHTHTPQPYCSCQRSPETEHLSVH